MIRLLRITKLFLLTVILVSFFACNTGNSEADKITFDAIENPVTADIDDSEEEYYGLPNIAFEETEFDFGEIISGETVSHKFKFKNVGTSPLVISRAEASCGCTVPSYSDKPILPGNIGEVSIEFNSQGREGFQEKTITLVTNTNPNSHILRIKSIVIMPER